MFDARDTFQGVKHPACAAMRAPEPMPRDERMLLAVTGMDSETCVAVVRHALLQVAGVAEVRCDLASQSVWVRLYPEQGCARQLPLVLASSGYPARLVQLRSTGQAT